MLKYIFINNFSQALQFGSRWILNIILLRSMNISEFGVFSFLYSISNFLSCVLPFGSSIFIFKENHINGKQNLVIDSFVVIFISFLIILFSYFFIFLFNININGLDYMFYPIILSLFLSLNIILASYLKSLDQFTTELKVNFIFFILLLGFILYVLILKQTNIPQIFQVLIFINLITTLFFINSLSLNIKFLDFKQSFYNLRHIFHLRLYYGLQEIQTAIYGQSSMIILFYLLNKELYGAYRALFILIMPVSLITYSITQVFINYLKQDIVNIKNRFKNIAFVSFIIACCVSVIFIIGQNILLSLIKLNIIYSNIYNILLLGVFFGILMMPCIALLVVLGMQKVRFYANLVGAIFLLLSTFLFVRDYDLFNSIFIYTISVVLIFLIKLTYTYKELKK